MPDIPACFDSHAQYEDWLKFAVIANEGVCICADCTPEYRERMQAANRCFPEKASVMFSVVRSRTKHKDKPATTDA